MYTILLVALTILVLFLIVLILLQPSSSDGLGGLGGGGANQFMTGRGAANFMTRTTAVLAAAFMLTSLVLATMASRTTEKSIIDTIPAEESAPLSPSVPLESAPQQDKPTPAAPAVPKPE